MTFVNLAEIEPLEILPGCRIRTPHGERLMLSYVELGPDAEVPTHQHPHEQGGVVLKGRLELTIGEETRLLEPGELYLIPSNLPHRAVPVGGPAVVLDIFTPIREDYARRLNRFTLPGGSESSKSSESSNHLHRLAKFIRRFRRFRRRGGGEWRVENGEMCFRRISRFSIFHFPFSSDSSDSSDDSDDWDASDANG